MRLYFQMQQLVCPPLGSSNMKWIIICTTQSIWRPFDRFLPCDCIFAAAPFGWTLHRVRARASVFVLRAILIFARVLMVDTAFMSMQLFSGVPLSGADTDARRYTVLSRRGAFQLRNSAAIYYGNQRKCMGIGEMVWWTRRHLRLRSRAGNDSSNGNEI